MKIVHIEDFFHPDAGYQINILPKYMIKQGHKVTVITSKMDKIPHNLTLFFGRNEIEKRDREYTEKTGVDILRLDLHSFTSGRAIFTNNLFRTVESLKPDVLYIHGNDTVTAMRYLLQLKIIDYPIVMDSHMLEMASVNRFNKLFRLFYKRIFAPIIMQYKIPVIRTQNDPYVEKCLGIPLKQCPWISIGSDTLLFYPDKMVRSDFRKRNKINDDDFIIVYAGKLDEVKGGRFLAQVFEKKFNTQKNIVLIVVGNTSGEYGKEVEKTLKKSQNRILRFSTQKYMDLAKFYQAADLSIFPKQCSLSFYDAQACGLPVISEDNNVNNDRLQYNNGFNFKAGSVDDFREKILKCLEMSERKYNQMQHSACEFVKENYDYEKISKQYTNLLISEYERYKEKPL